MDITIKGQQVLFGKEPPMAVKDFCELIAENSATGLNDNPLPDGVKWLVRSGQNSVYVLELPPAMRLIECDMGRFDGDGFHEGESGKFSVATPYVVVVVWFKGLSIYNVQVFYRNSPLKSIDDKLYFTNLPNMAGSSMCIDGIGRIRKDHAPALGAIVNHLWSGEFNTEMGNSFKDFANYSCDSRLASIEAWEKASKKDPNFVLGVNWEQAYSVRVVITNYLDQQLHNAHRLCNLLLTKKKEE